LIGISKKYEIMIIYFIFVFTRDCDRLFSLSEFLGKERSQLPTVNLNLRTIRLPKLSVAQTRQEYCHFICYAETTCRNILMKAYEFSTTITPDGKLELPEHLKHLPSQPKVRVIVLIEEFLDVSIEEQDEVYNPNPAKIAATLHRSIQEVKAGQRKPISQLWDSLDGN